MTLLSLFPSLAKRRRPMLPDPKTHQLEIGPCCTVHTVAAQGRHIVLEVFGYYGHIETGDYLILTGRYSKLTTRYQVDRISHPTDPDDQWFFYCTFAPRPA